MAEKVLRSGSFGYGGLRPESSTIGSAIAPSRSERRGARWRNPLVALHDSNERAIDAMLGVSTPSRMAEARQELAEHMATQQRLYEQRIASPQSAPSPRASFMDAFSDGFDNILNLGDHLAPIFLALSTLISAIEGFHLGDMIGQLMRLPAGVLSAPMIFVSGAIGFAIAPLAAYFFTRKEKRDNR